MKISREAEKPLFGPGTDKTVILKQKIPRKAKKGDKKTAKKGNGIIFPVFEGKTPISD